MFCNFLISITFFISSTKMGPQKWANCRKNDKLSMSINLSPILYKVWVIINYQGWNSSSSCSQLLLRGPQVLLIVLTCCTKKLKLTTFHIKKRNFVFKYEGVSQLFYFVNCSVSQPLKDWETLLFSHIFLSTNEVCR